MDNLKGIIFLLESALNSSKKQLMSSKIVVDPNEIFPLIEKLKEAIVQQENYLDSSNDNQVNSNNDLLQNDEIVDAQKAVFKIRKEADNYADGVLARLQLLVTKLQKNMIKVEKSISEGRKLIEQHQMEQNKGDHTHAS